MAKNISILGASYSDVPAVTLPTTQGGTASFTDITDTTATDDDVVEGKVFYSASGVRTTGTGISRNQVQTLVEENKVKHVYGIDGYTENLIDPIYFDGDGRLYTPGQNNTKTYWTQIEYVNFLQAKMTALAGSPCFLKMDNVRWPLYANLDYSTYAVTLTTAEQTATISIGNNEIIITFLKNDLKWVSPLQIGKLQIEENSQNSLCSIVENRLANAAEGAFAHAEGDYTFAQGWGSHAEGGGTQALRDFSHAQGNFTVAQGFTSHAEGNYTIAKHKSQHVFGQYNIEDSSSNDSITRGNYVEIVGNGTVSARSNARTLDWEGNERLAGNLTLGAGTQDEITITPKNTTAKYVYGIDAYKKNTLFKIYFDSTQNRNIYTLEDGLSNYDLGSEYLSSISQAVNGYSSVYINGVEYTYSAVNWPSRVSFTSIDGGTNLYVDQSNQKCKLRIPEGTTFDSPITICTPPIVVYNVSTDPIITFYYDQEFKVYSLDNDQSVYWDQAKLEEFITKAGKGFISVDDTEYMAFSPEPLFIEFQSVDGNAFSLEYDSGVIVQFSGTSLTNPVVVYPGSLCSVVENDVGNVASNQYSHAEGGKTTASGGASHAEGSLTTASGNSSHAEGSRTTASGNDAHAEGFKTSASGISSHTEGEQTVASGDNSHAEGNMTTASGLHSHAEGSQTIATSKSQHVFGEFNVGDESSATQRGTYVEIVGNGTSDNSRSNARTLDWSGNERLAGSITIGAGTSNEVTLTAADLLVIMEKCGLSQEQIG